MAKRRLDKTLADYIVIAISPALIMTLVGSLVFFLLEVCYRGQFETRMHWIMFWFVFAAVLVARIAIEEGREHAQIFGIAMCVVAAIAVFRFVDAAIIGWILLAVTWWCSSKLTWDCTLIDELQDTSGEGLLQAGGFDRDGRAATEATNPDHLASDADKAKPSAGTSQKMKKRKLAAEADNPSQKLPDESVNANSSNENVRPHSPGLWVVYFSLAALPLFGVGQLFIPAQETSRRSYAFQMLAIYVASAIALLLTTSFLGLRRYLRQRKLEMPASISRSWLGFGCAILISLMLLATIIPRPQGEYTLTAMIEKIDSKARQASQFALLKNDRADGEGRRIGDQDPASKQPGQGSSDQKPGDQKQGPPPEAGKAGGKNSGNAEQGKQQESSGKNQNQNDGKSNSKQQGQNQSNQQSDRSEKENRNEKKSGQADQRQNTDGQQNQNGQKRDDEKRGEQSRNSNSEKKSNSDTNSSKDSPSGSTTSRFFGWIALLTKWILYGLIAIVGLYFLIRHWSQIVETLRKLWTELLSLFVRKSKSAAATGSTDIANVTPFKRAFASYENPFFNGAADRMTSPQLIRYTFEALEAWSREQVIERSPEQTPLEFAHELGRRVPALAKDVVQTVHLYSHIAYAQRSPSKDRLEVLERLWRQLRA